jgi:hypothetical protein
MPKWQKRNGTAGGQSMQEGSEDQEADHAAIVNSPERATEVVIASYEKEADETAATLLERKAIMLSKQVSKYCASTRCTHIILSTGEI